MPSGRKPPVNPFAHEVNAIIRGHLARIGWTHGDLAHRIGISTSQMSRILRGDRHLDVDQFDRICRALNLSPVAVIQEAWEESRDVDQAELDEEYARLVPDGPDEGTERITGA